MFESTMMDMPLTIDILIQRAQTVSSHVEVVSRRADRSLHRTTYGKVADRALQLSRALLAGGIKKGDRIATLMWNHSAHLEAYLGIPMAGAIIHTLNLRLHPDEIAYIADDAKDRWLIVDEVLLPLFDAFKSKYPFEKVIVVDSTKPLTEGRIEYEALLKSAPKDLALPVLKETDALGSCYTSGTTGRPKGVVYSHRSTLLHSVVSALPDSLQLSFSDCLMAVVPMFHVNAWGLPYTALLVGAKQVLPGPFLDPTSLLDLMEEEKVTVAAGVPTIWMGMREALDAKPRNLKARMVVGGSAAPEQLIRDFDRHGLEVIHAWGMTETSPIGLVAKLSPEAKAMSLDDQYHMRAKQGLPPPFVQVRVCNDAGEVPNDGKTSGEIQIRAPWVTQSYASNDSKDRWTKDGFFCTGDVATRDKLGYVQINDRIADLIKSGGEWIASQQLENALMGHPSVREAAVIGVPHEKWSERPLAAIVLKPDMKASADELRAFIAPQFAKLWLPDAFVYLDTIPRTSAGKFKKSELREMYKNWKWEK